MARLQEKEEHCRCGSRGVSDCQTVWFLNWGGYLCSIIAWSLPTQSSMKLYIFHTQLFHSFFCTTSWRQQSPTFMSEVISNLIQVLGKKGVRTTSNTRKCPRNQPSMGRVLIPGHYRSVYSTTCIYITCIYTHVCTHKYAWLHKCYGNMPEPC